MPAIRLPDGRIIQNVPEGTTKAQLTEKLVRNGVIKGDEDWMNSAPIETSTDSQAELPEQATQQSLLDKVAGKGSILEKIGRFGALPEGTTENIAKGVGRGLDQLGTGIYQTLADTGYKFELPKKILSKIKPDLANEINNMTPEDISEVLADKTKMENKQDEDKPLSYNLSKSATKVAPYLAVGNKMKLLKGAATGGAVMGLTSAQEESGLKNRLIQGAKDVGESVATAGTLKLGVEGVKLGAKILPLKPLALRGLAAAGNKKAITSIALNDLRKGLKREGQDAGELLNSMKEKGVDLIDVLDPRYATYTKGLKGLNRPETIKIADESLKKVNTNVDKLQGELVDLISKNKVSPEDAGDILGRNSKKLFDQSIAARRAKAAPLYKKGLNSGTKIPLDTKLKINAGKDANLQELGLEEEMSLDMLLKSPVVRDAISDARKKSLEFSSSPSEHFYGKIYEEAKPKTEKSPLGFIYPEEKGAAKQFKIPDNDVRVLNAVDNILYDKIKEMGLTGATKEQGALMGVRSQVSKLLDNASPDLAKARRYWKADSQDLDAHKNSLIGKYAKYYTEGKSDELTKAAMDVLKMQPTRISIARKTNPEEFNDLFRSSVENRIANINPIDDSPVNPKAFNKAFFGQDGKGKQLEAALDDKELFQGFKKLADDLDIKFQRNRVAKGAMESQARGSKIMTGKTAAINRGLEFIEDKIIANPAAQKQFVEFMFTDRGKAALKIIAKTKNQATRSKLVDNMIFTSALTASNLSTGE